MTTVTKKYDSIQYDGTNGSYIAGTWNTYITFVSDNGTTFVYQDGDDTNRNVSVGNWLTQQMGVGDSFPALETNSEYLARWVPVPEAQTFDLTLAAGYALTPTILASASANVAVDLDTTMSGTGYEASAVLAGAASLLGSLAITGVSITDNNTVTVTVQNNGVVSLAGATVIVAAAELAS